MASRNGGNGPRPGPGGRLEGGGDWVKMAADSAAHGGVVALQGGPWHGFWFFTDEYEAMPGWFSQREGYVHTGGEMENPVTCDLRGWDLRGYGPGRVWRFDAAALPGRPPRPAPEPRPAGVCAKCAQHAVGPGGVLCPGCWEALAGRVVADAA